MLHGIAYPPLHTIEHLEGKGNFAVSKYYKLPFRFFYRHKFKMIVKMMGKQRYHRILDFGSGSGIFRTELQRHGNFVMCVDKGVNRLHLKYDAVVCASVLEFCNLNETLTYLKSIMKPGATLFVASPMQTKWTMRYFNAIGDTHTRNSHFQIKEAVEQHFKLQEYTEWLGLYFAIKATIA